MVDALKVYVLRGLFYFRIRRHITASTLLISLDETAFNHKVANNKWWIQRDIKNSYSIVNSLEVDRW